MAALWPAGGRGDEPAGLALHSTGRPYGVPRENLLWVRRFDTIEELRRALAEFGATYNRTWIIERHGYQTPAQVRAAQINQIPLAA